MKHATRKAHARRLFRCMMVIIAFSIVMDSSLLPFPVDSNGMSSEVLARRTGKPVRPAPRTPATRDERHDYKEERHDDREDYREERRDDREEFREEDHESPRDYREDRHDYYEDRHEDRREYEEDRRDDYRDYRDDVGEERWD